MTDNPADSVVTEAMTLTRRLQLVYDWLEERGQRYHCQTLDIVMSQASPPPEAANEIERLRIVLSELRPHFAFLVELIDVTLGDEGKPE